MVGCHAGTDLLHFLVWKVKFLVVILVVDVYKRQENDDITVEHGSLLADSSRCTGSLHGLVALGVKNGSENQGSDYPSNDTSSDVTKHLQHERSP